MSLLNHHTFDSFVIVMGTWVLFDFFNCVVDRILCFSFFLSFKTSIFFQCTYKKDFCFSLKRRQK